MTDKTMRQLFVERLAKVGVLIISPATSAFADVIAADRDVLTALTDEQFAELDAAINDLVKSGRRPIQLDIAAEGPELLNTTDASVWSSEFVRLADSRTDDEVFDGSPGSWVHGWFANAIEVGRSAGFTAGEQSIEYTEIAIMSPDEVDEALRAMKAGVNHPVKITPEAVSTIETTLLARGAAEQRRAGLNDTGEVPTLTLDDVNAVEIDINPDRSVILTVDARIRATLGKADRVIIRDPFGGRYVVLREGEPLEALPVTHEPVDGV